MLALLAQQFLNGLSIGMAYVLVALGLTLIYGILHVVNFSHGELYMIGAFSTFLVVNFLGVPYWIAVLAATLTTTVVALVIERITVRPFLAIKDGHHTIMLTTYAAALLIFDGVVVSWGTAPQRVFGFPGSVSFLNLTLSTHRIVVLVAGTVLIAAIWTAVHHSAFGKKLKAVAENRFAAAVVGIPVDRVGTITFVIAGGLAGLAGSLLVPLTLFTPYVGQNIIIKGFVVVVVGGMGSIAGAAVCGLALGVVEAIGSVFMPPGINLSLIYGALIVVLLLRPHGLFGAKSI